MKECTECLFSNKTDYSLSCPDGLRNPNLCVDIVIDQLLKKLMSKGFWVVYHAFYVSHQKGSMLATVRIELILDKVYDESLFELLPDCFVYYPTTYRAEFLSGKNPNFILHYTHPTRSLIMYIREVNMETINARSTLVQAVEALAKWCEGACL